MEILAVLSALRAVNNKDININLYSDSKYALDGMTSWMHNWAKKLWKKEIKHKNTWQEIYSLYNFLKVDCIWVKGHANNLYNERCDKIARNLIKDNV